MKRYQVYISCSFFLLLHFYNIAQSDTIDLQSYRPPDFTFKSLVVYPDLKQTFTNAQDFKRTTFKMGAIGNYLVQKMEGKNTSEFNVLIDTDYSYSKLGDSTAVPNNLFSTTVNADYSLDHYFQEPAFVRFGVKYRSNVNRIKGVNENSSWSNNLTVPFGFGYGRPFDITDAWLAETIVEDLERNGFDVNRQNLQSLADTIYLTKRKRVKDPRLQYIEQLNTIYEHFEAERLKDLTPIAAALIYDSFRFEAFIRRQSGWRVYAGIAPGLIWDTNSSLDPVWEYELGLESFLAFDYYLPINKDWQVDSEFLATMRSAALANNNVALDIDWYSTVGWYVSQRTFLFASILFDYLDNLNEINPIKTVGVGTGVSLQYYFSPSLALQTSTYFRNTWQITSAETAAKNINQNFNFSLVYRIL